jgi:hypothetical protein
LYNLFVLEKELLILYLITAGIEYRTFR